jgi:hypothetical protein
MNWKWSNGEIYYKSSRKINKSQDKSQDNMTYSSEINAINLSLNEEQYTNYDTSKREVLDDKLSNRELVFQRGTNPFMNQTSYVDDVMTRDMYLKPISTTTKHLTNPKE